MTKYNTPHDQNLLTLFSRLTARVNRLERFNKATSLNLTVGIKASDYNTPVAVTSGTFATTHYFDTSFYAQTPVAYIMVQCTDGTTAGEFKLVDGSGVNLTDINGNAVAVMPIPVGTTSYTLFSNNQNPNYWSDDPIGTDLLYQLQVRRTAGAGTINVKAAHMIQVPS